MTGAGKRKKSRRSKAQIVRARDGDNCWLCGEPVLFNVNPRHEMFGTLDHVIERRNGGSNSTDNLKLAHRICNEQRHKRFPHTNNDHRKQPSFPPGDWISDGKPSIWYR